MAAGRQDAERERTAPRLVRRVILSGLRRRLGRTLALFGGILVAVSAFVVLTGTSEVQQLAVRGSIARSFHAAYDILVRPAGSQSAYERRTGRVRPNYLSGLFGGISMAQWHRIERLPGISVAAPIANVGYVLPTVTVPVDLTGVVPARGSVLFRVRLTWISDRGLSRVPDAADYLYVTDRPLLPASGVASLAASPRQDYAAFSPGERLPGGRVARICPPASVVSSLPNSPFAVGLRSDTDCFSRQTGFRGAGWAPFGRGHFGIQLTWPFPFLLSAIAPGPEARLDGVSRAVIQGRYLNDSDQVRSVSVAGEQAHEIPVLAASASVTDETAALSVQRLSPTAAAGLPRVGLPKRPGAFPLVSYLDRQPGGPVIDRVRIGVNRAYQQFLRTLAPHAHSDRTYGAEIDQFWTVGQTSYSERQKALVPLSVPQQPNRTWVTVGSDSYAFVPAEERDVQFRRLTDHNAKGVVNNQFGNAWLYKVGTFDPSRLPGFSPLTRLPLETYEPPTLAAGDQRANRLLRGRALEPNANLGGYLAQPPLLITTLRAVQAFEPPFFPNASTAPISAIRVRVAGVTGPNPVSRERIRLAAQRIATTTHLEVDITAGASPAPTALDLPAGRFGRPALRLRENWVQKNVVAVILKALDRKGLLLFALVLVVCALFVANAAFAAVRTRRTELAVLACLGWTRAKLFGLVFGELALIGLSAGVCGALASLPLSAATGVQVSVNRSVLAIPAAVLLAVLAGVWPAVQAARAHPYDATRPAVVGVRHAHRARSVSGMALMNLLRVPGRTALGAISVMIGVAALTLLLAARVAFGNALVGTLLGQAISVQVRPSDYAAVAIIVVLGAGAVTDVLFLNVRERSRELATLRAVGWSERSLTRLVSTEGLAIGAFGSLIGGSVGLAGAALFAGAVPTTLILTTLAAVSAGTLITALAAIGPSAWLARLDPAPLLAGE